MIGPYSELGVVFSSYRANVHISNGQICNISPAIAVLYCIDPSGIMQCVPDAYHMQLDIYCMP